MRAWMLAFALVLASRAFALDVRTVPTADGSGLAQATVETALYRVSIRFDQGGKLSEFFDKKANANGVAWNQPAGSGFLDDRHVFSGMQYRTGRVAQQPDRVVIPCSVRSEDGVELRKTYTFEEGKPFFRVGYEVLNHGYKPYALWVKCLGVPCGGERTKDDVSVTFVTKGERQSFTPWPSNYFGDIGGGWMALVRASKRAGYFVVAEPSYLDRFYFWPTSPVSPTFEWIYRPVEPGHSFRTTVLMGLLSDVERVEWIDQRGAVTRPPQVPADPPAPTYAKIEGWKGLDELYQPTAEEKARGFIPTVLSTETPRKRLTAIAVDVGRNEGEFVPVEVFAVRQLKGARLEIMGDAARDGSLRIEAEKGFKLLPEGGEVEVPAGAYGRLWLRVLPSRQERVVSGAVAVVCEGGRAELPLRVTVWPVDFPAADMLPLNPMIGPLGMGAVGFLDGADKAMLPAMLDAMQALGSRVCPWPFSANPGLTFKATREKKTGLPIHGYLAKHGPVTLDTLPDLDFSGWAPVFAQLKQRGMTRIELQTGIKGGLAGGWEGWSGFGKAALGREPADAEEGWRLILWVGRQYGDYLRSRGLDDLWAKIGDEISPDDIPAWLEAARRWRSIGFKVYTTNTIGIPRSAELLSRMNEQSDGWMVATVFTRDFLDRTRRGGEVKAMRGALAPPKWSAYGNGGAANTWVTPTGFRSFPPEVDPVHVEDFSVTADGRPLEVKQGTSPWGNRKEGVAFRIGNSVYVSLPGGAHPDGVKFEVAYNVRSATAEGRPAVELKHRDSQWYYGGGYFNDGYLAQRRQTWLGSYFRLNGRGHYVVFSSRPTHFMIWHDKDKGVVFSPAYEGLRDSAEDSAYYRRLAASGAPAEVLESVVGFGKGAALPLAERRSEAYAWDDVAEGLTFDDYTLAKRRMLAALTPGNQGGGPPMPAYRWTAVTRRAPFAPRDGAGALTHKGKMWLLGGWNPRDKASFPRVCNNEVWSSADGVAWTLVKPNTFRDAAFKDADDWEGRHTAGYVVFQDKMWIVGGDPIQGHYQNDVWNSADGKTWACVARNVPWGPRVLHYTVAFKDRIWVMGGQTLPQFAKEEERFYRDIWSSRDGVTWEKVEAKEPYWCERGMIGGSVVFRDRMWILGGGTYDTPKAPVRRYFTDVWSSADGVNWTCHTEKAPWYPRQYHDVAVFDGRMWLLEGANVACGNRNDVWHSEDGATWTELANTPWPPRHAASVFVHDDALWMVAGNNMQPDVWKLTRTDGGGRQ